MFHLFLTSHMYCRVCYPFLWQCVTLDFSKHSQIPGLAQELQGVCPCCGAAALESTPWSGWPWIFWMMCCDPWLLEQTRVCSMPALVRAIPCMCCGWNIQASPTAGDRTKTWLSDVPQTNSRCVHGCWLNPECFWTFWGSVCETTGKAALLVSPLLCSHCDGLLCCVCSTGTSPPSPPVNPTGFCCLQILVGSWAQAFQTKVTPFAAPAEMWANSGSCGYGLGLLLSNRGSGSLICK